MQLINIFAYFLFHAVSSLPCKLKKFNEGFVCVCNEFYCDTLDFSLPQDDSVKIVSTSKNGLRYLQSTAKFANDRTEIKDINENFTSSEEHFPNRNSVNTIRINKSIKFQKVIGFGTAFTGAVSYNLKRLPETLVNSIYDSYFSKENGNGFNIIRLSIGGCDFDLNPWAYNEQPINDHNLSNFTHLDPRDIEKITQIKKLMNLTNNNEIKFIGAAWSPPKWMKTNNDWTGLSVLKYEFYQTWADYHVKFLELWNERGINFWAISTGNEPGNGIWGFAFTKFMSLGWVPKQQGQWVAENLGPAIENSKYISNVKILAGDDQRFTFPWWFNKLYSYSPMVKNYVYGHAVHWYWDKIISSNLLANAHNQYRDKVIISTEACSGDKPWDVHGPVLGIWSRCEDYVTDIIEDLNNYVSAWIDWNLILDHRGGPNYVNNFVDSAMVISEDGEEVYKQPIFYALGHFSRFLIQDSVRINSETSNQHIFVTSFIRPDDFTVVVIYNSANIKINVDLSDDTHGVLKLNLPPKSIHTLVYK